MFVVMADGASEAEILGVKGLLMAEGMGAFEHRSSGHARIAVVGEMGKRRTMLTETLAALPGVETVTRDQSALQVDLARIPSRGHRHPGAGHGRSATAR